MFFRVDVARVGLVAAALAMGLVSAACTNEATPEPTPTSSPSESTSAPADVAELTFGAYGPPGQLAAFGRVVDAFNATSTTRKVELVTWPDHRAALAAVQSGDAPDVFMAARSDLGELVEGEDVRPLGLLLDERGVDFGDRFARAAVESFGLGDDLQCMPYSISPMVVYYNTELVDFDQMAAEELDVPGEARERWSMEEFAAAAEFAARRGNTRGVWIDPTLEGLAPFVYSGGGQVFDDETEPTSMAFSEESSREALNELLTVLRDPTLTPTSTQLERFTPLQLFKRGRLAMVAGYRDLVPELRRVDDLDFDVISMPVLDSPATVGDIDGLCLSADTEEVNHAADFLAYAVSDSAVETVTSTGHIVPANTQVAGSEEFLETDRMPAHSRVFNTTIRGMVIPPFIDERDALVEAVEPLLQRMVMAPGILDLERTTEQIDMASRTVLQPDEETSEQE